MERIRPINSSPIAAMMFLPIIVIIRKISKVLMICTYQFSDGKIKELHYTMDTLELAKQAAEGFF